LSKHLTLRRAKEKSRGKQLLKRKREKRNRENKTKKLKRLVKPVMIKMEMLKGKVKELLNDVLKEIN
jgi:hypothetical protein